MPLLVLAQTPPPTHGQSIMVATLLGLRDTAPDLEIHHVNLDLSPDTASIGRWQISKWRRLNRAIDQALALAAKHGPMTLYYVPAPGKLSAALRDVWVMHRCRPAFTRVVLHWHASGLGEWVGQRRWLRSSLHRALDGADLAIVPALAGATDAEQFIPKRLRVVANGIEDPGLIPEAGRIDEVPRRLLYLGLITASKGIFELLEAVKRRHGLAPGSLNLTVAGDFAGPADRDRFLRACRGLETLVRHVGFAENAAKHALLKSCDIVCLPTRYPHEAQPLVALEALAADRLVVATRWRGLPETLRGTHHWLAEPGNVTSLEEAVRCSVAAPPANGANRAVFLQRHTCAIHLQALAASLREVSVA